MTETTTRTTYSFPTEDEKNEAYIEDLETQVSSLTKERDELKHDVEKRMQVADKIFKENRDLQSQLSNREKEIEELKGTISALEGSNPSRLDCYYYNRDLGVYEEDAYETPQEFLYDCDHGEVVELHRFGSLSLPTIWCTVEKPENGPTIYKNFSTKEEALASLNKEGEEE